MGYFQESFSAEEEAILNRYFTNIDQPVFAVINLPEVVKGALFARYSRTSKSIRRLFLDEFWDNPQTGLDVVAAGSVQEVDIERARGLYQRVFHEYGDDSVAQLGGAHLACEQASNVLTKILEWGRLASYLEQSTRYIFYDTKLGDRYRYHLPTELDQEPKLRSHYVEVMDHLFITYSEMVADLDAYFRQVFPHDPDDPERVWKATIKAKACDTARGLLPASTLSNVGIFGSGQAYEMALVRMQAHPLAEVRDYGQMMTEELRKVIPAFLTRVDLADRGVAWSKYLADVSGRLAELAGGIGSQAPQARSVRLVDWDPSAEDKIIAAALFPWTASSDNEITATVAKMSEEQKQQVFAALVGERGNRRHKPGRAAERTLYRFEVVCDFGSFRDLQRHRLMTIDWQRYSTRLGYDIPAGLNSAQLAQWEDCMGQADQLYTDLVSKLGPEVGQYAVPFASHVRFVIDLNPRQAFHLIELRSQSAGHPIYRWVAQEMHRQIAEVAGHRRLADAMKFVDHSQPDLGRLASERSTEAKRQQFQK